MANTFYYTGFPVTSLMTTELNSLGSAAFASALTAYDNTTGAYWGDFEWFSNQTGNFSGGGTIDLYLLESVDGTNFANTGGPPPNAYAGSFVVQAESSSARYALRGVSLPPSKFRAYVKNAGGIGLSASANTLKLLPYGQYIV